jgi:hypothetical protein
MRARAVWAALFFFVGVYFIVAVAQGCPDRTIQKAKIGAALPLEDVDILNMPIEVSGRISAFGLPKLVHVTGTMGPMAFDGIVGEDGRIAQQGVPSVEQSAFREK